MPSTGSARFRGARAAREVVREDVSDREDPQRRPRGPRRSRQDLARRGAAVHRRGDPPDRAGSRTARPSATSTPRSSDAPSRSRSRSRPSSSTVTRSTSSTPRATPTSSATSPPRCRPPTSRCSSSPRSRASRCRPRSRWTHGRGASVSRAIVFVNKLDRERASFEQTLDQLKERFGAGIAPLQLPIGEEAGVPRRRRAAVGHGRDLRRRLAARHGGSGARRHGGRGALGARRARRGHRRRRRRPHGALPRRRADRHRRSSATRSRPASTPATVFPVLCGSATKLIGVDRLARFIVEEGPEPHVTGDDGQTALFVFKTIVDPYVGHVNLFKVLQGVAEARRRARERSHRARRAHAPALHDARQGAGAGKELHAGDIAAVAKLGDTTTGDVLAERGTDLAVDAVRAARAAARGRDPREVEERRGQARERAAPAAGRGPGRCASTATPRPTRRCSRAWARRTCRSRSRSWRASSASRSRPRTCGSRTARRSPARPRPRAR